MNNTEREEITKILIEVFEKETSIEIPKSRKAMLHVAIAYKVEDIFSGTLIENKENIYNNGYNSGYESGHREGMTDLDAEVDDAFKSGGNAGERRGYDTGYTEGKKVGHEEGYWRGHNDASLKKIGLK